MPLRHHRTYTSLCQKALNLKLPLVSVPLKDTYARLR
jgi:hypothetical protein